MYKGVAHPTGGPGSVLRRNRGPKVLYRVLWRIRLSDIGYRIGPGSLRMTITPVECEIERKQALNSGQTSTGERPIAESSREVC